MISCQFEQYSKKNFLKKHQLTVNQLGVFNEDECIIDIFFILSFHLSKFHEFMGSNINYSFNFDSLPYLF